MSDKTKCPTCGEDRNHTRLDACLFDYQNYLARTTAALEAENAELKAALDRICGMFPNPMANDGTGQIRWTATAIDIVTTARALLKGG